MALNFTGRLTGPSDPEPKEAAGPSRVILGILVLAVAAFLGALMVFSATRLGGPARKAEPAPTLVGVAPPAPVTPAAASPPPPAPKAAAASEARPAVRSAPVGPAAPSRRDLFLAALRRAPGQVTLMVEDDADAQAYARELQDLFSQAGWTVSWSQAFGSGAPERGLAAALGSTPQDGAVRDAFAAAGMPLTGSAPSGGIVQTPELFVGAPFPAARAR